MAEVVCFSAVYARNHRLKGLDSLALVVLPGFSQRGGLLQKDTVDTTHWLASTKTSP
jgi:hypothetical protein